LRRNGSGGKRCGKPVVDYGAPDEPAGAVFAGRRAATAAAFAVRLRERPATPMRERVRVIVRLARPRAAEVRATRAGGG